MTGILQRISDGFWNEDVWLPPNTTWKDIAPGSSAEIEYSKSKHLYISIPLIFLVLGVRFCLEKYWFTPIGISLGIQNYRPKKAPTNAVLEKTYSSTKKLSHKQIQGLAKQLDWTERKVERWLRLRRSQDKPSTLVKFCENAWRCLYYLSSFTYGIVMLWDKPWLWNLNECWYSYPHQSLADGVWWYYIVSLAFYLSQCVSQFFDVKRTDFWQMFVHHIATIFLLSFTWITNLHRMGSLVLVIHDCADIFVEAAKMAKYSGYHKVSNALFALFTIVWIVTRLGVYPFWIIHSTFVEAPKFFPLSPACYICNGLLLLLLVLNIFWTILILKVVYMAINAGQIKGDIRSSSSNYSEDSKSQ